MKENVIQQKSFTFAVRIVRLYRFLLEHKESRLIAGQLLRSGTSIGANVKEAQGAVSKKDFINKMSIAYKESRETHYWLRLLHECELFSDRLFSSMCAHCDELSRLLYSIIASTRSTTDIQRN